MPYVSLHPQGGGDVTFRDAPTHHIPDSYTPARSREAAIALLIAHAVDVGEVIDVEVADIDQHLTLWVHPDGQVVVVASNTRPHPSTTPHTALPALADGEDTDTPPRGIPPVHGPAGDADDDTVLSARRTPSLTVSVQFASGDVVSFSETAVLGRAPRPQPRYGDCVLIRVPDAQGSVSKTHCVITVVDGIVELIDLESTNGTDVGRNGKEWTAPPGTPIQLQDGDTVHLGDSAALVRIVRAGPGDV